jgi:hypothetical protein
MKQAILRYRGRAITASDIEFIKQLVVAHPDKSRRQLSTLLCQAWKWQQPNGVLRDMVCRSFMLHLHRAGLIELPAVRQRTINNVIARRSNSGLALCKATPVQGRLEDIQPIEFVQVRRTGDEKLFGALLQAHHYLGYKQPVGEHLKYLVVAAGQPVACLAWCSAPRHLGPRDRFIGWGAEARRRNIRFLAYNTRFLVLPWVQVRHLASHVLGRMARLLSDDWQKYYGHPVYYLETFVDPQRFRGTCYRAANWMVLGRTTGRGNNAPTYKVRVPIKEILGYPLTKDFRERLGKLS